MLLPLLIGAAIGIGVLFALALVFGDRGAKGTWRGSANAVAIGLALGAMFDLLPAALEQFTIILGIFLRFIFVDMLALLNPPLGLGGSVTTQAATAVGALVVLFLFLTGNTLPMVVDGNVQGTLKGGWRDRFVIPEAGTFDRIGVVLLTVGLAMQNLWSGQQRGVLVEPDADAADLFLYCIALFGALRGLALFGPFVDPRQRAVPFISCVVLIAAAIILGILYPDTMGTFLLGVVPLFVGVLVLPLALGRLLKVLQLDIGMSWQASFIVLAALAVERGANMLLVRMAQGQF